MAIPNARRRRSANTPTDSIVRGLGWFSIGLGLAQILAPRAVCRLVGVPPAPMLTRLCGMRELACGIGILTQRQPGPWFKARVMGDVMDIACLAGATPLAASRGGRLALSLAAVGGITALDAHCVQVLSEEEKPSPVYLRTGIEIARSANELYEFWRDFQNLPRVMPHLKSVEPIDGSRSRWIAKGPGGGSIEWVSELIDDQPGSVIAWRSVDGSSVWNAGSVSFQAAPGAQSTSVTVELLYYPVAGSISAAFAKLFGGDAEEEVRADLDAFKQMMEAGAAAT